MIIFLLRPIQDVESLVRKLGSLDEFCFDTETTSLNSLDTELVAIAFSWEEAKGYMVYFPDDINKTKDCWSC